MTVPRLGLSKADRRLATAVLFIALLAMAPAAWSALAGPAERGELVFLVFSSGDRTTLSAERDGIYQFTGPLGTTTVEVLEGRAGISSSPCRHPCWHGGWLSRDGQASICLPNRVVLTVRGGEACDFDGETY